MYLVISNTDDEFETYLRTLDVEDRENYTRIFSVDEIPLYECEGIKLVGEYFLTSVYQDDYDELMYYKHKYEGVPQ